jgi:hypothetical protein
MTEVADSRPSNPQKIGRNTPKSPKISTVDPNFRSLNVFVPQLIDTVISFWAAPFPLVTGVTKIEAYTRVVT